MLDLESLDIADTDYTMFPRTFADGTKVNRDASI